MVLLSSRCARHTSFSLYSWVILEVDNLSLSQDTSVCKMFWLLWRMD